jgi:hypothetical protein
VAPTPYDSQSDLEPPDSPDCRLYPVIGSNPKNAIYTLPNEGFARVALLDHNASHTLNSTEVEIPAIRVAVG